ncbi:nucleoside hydrolase [Alteromonas sp. 5E99-2]|uniref:nucleoside hydrolase n=1 Tax=Alteromonas sp. 5E99-2 TaxID=2817683 RepID=UPI001A99C9B2|nr:nucleoside hydrolase [Alteromonas sp. 5E99-2]MBO1254628.1 nucleoside hydrolase [Alteromonas sp. 5E99-2]
MKSEQCRPVLFDHDGGIDDLLSLLLLVRMPNINLLGVTITPADCYADDAVISSRKLLAMTGNSHVPVSEGTIAGPNPFPPEWRAQPKMCHAMPVMLRTDETDVPVSTDPAHVFIQKQLEQSDKPVTVLMTGPASNLAQALKERPDLIEKVEKVVWMGGAVEVNGNVAMHDHNRSAEWNAYWHPQATKELLSCGVKVCMVPLDATNAFPVDRSLLHTLAEKNTPVSDLVGQFWAATTTAIPSYEFTYFLWDILSTAVLTIPEDKMTIETSLISVSVNTPNAGQTYLDAEKGSSVSWLKSTDVDYVKAMVVHYLSGEFLVQPERF